MPGLPLKALHENPIVVRLALSLDSTPFSVAGRLRALWEYFETHAPNGAGMIGQSVIDMVICHEGFASALAEEGILAFDGDHVEVMLWRPAIVLDVAAPDESDPAWLAGWEARECAYELAQAEEIDRKRALAAARKRTSRERKKAHVTVTVTPRSRYVTVTERDILETGGKVLAFPPTPSVGIENAAFKAKAASLKTENKTEAGDTEHARLLKTLTDGGLCDDDARWILANPAGTAERISWAIRTLSARSESARAKGSRIHNPAKYLRSLILKTSDGPRPRTTPNASEASTGEFSPAREIGGAPAPHPQARKVALMQQIAAIKQTKSDFPTAPPAQKV